MGIEIFTKEEWQVVWDNIIANITSVDYIYAVGISYLVYNRNILMKLQNIKEFENFFHQMNQGFNMKEYLDLVAKTK